jgi:hypothetical protein
VALSGAIAGDAVADLVEAPELFDVDVIAGVIAFTAGAGAEAYSWRTRLPQANSAKWCSSQEKAPPKRG